MNLEPGDKGRERLAPFADELSAHRYLEDLLWPNGVCCPHCASSGRVGKLNGGSTRVGTYKCYVCRKTFSVLHGTLMSSSHVPAHKWLQAMYLTEGGTKPMRSHQLHRILNVSFKTASSMMRRLERAAAQLHREPSADEAPLAAPSFGTASLRPNSVGTGPLQTGPFGDVRPSVPRVRMRPRYASGPSAPRS